ncbi:hypothetical protein GVO57_02190 [Sphingomonas changnyeongensis]|uniref:Uncharacterized protein n=1 Tax=Sphingomonas changnyeongensis TaxID=2698679 RepID=A0A7Z2S7P8_9SPHN|nr:hypothetical protein [Sphingomonas changnyeongensis]QHL89847.1 hypothetical protein GVO57_02190 [Sphingomonas changnyeongensis]
MTDMNDPLDMTPAGSWQRYRQLMRWMTLAALGATLATIGGLWWVQGPLPWLFLAFTAGGIFFSVVLAAALMGLVFLSAASGHDDQIQDFSEDDDDQRQ